MRRLLTIFLLAATGLLSVPVHAHKPSDSYLTLKVSDKSVEGQWDIALRDLDFAIGLDQDGNGELTWGEIRAHQRDIAAYALGHLTLSNAGTKCPITSGLQLVDNHSDGAYSVLRFTASCSAQIEKLDVDYRLLFDIDPQHRGLLNLQSGGQNSTAIFSPGTPHQTLVLREASKLAQFEDYLITGIWHIWKGFDHILFLLSLLLPAVLQLGDKERRPSDSFKASFIDVLKIVTAFTLAHSMTLTLATLQVISLPSRWVESAIAASVVLAALNNLFPLFQGKRWMVAFAFGLIHGFGFASVLTDLGLPQSSLLLALVGFNLGVEIGQLAIVSVFLPLAYAIRRTMFYRSAVFSFGSSLIVLIATVWLVERLFDLRIFTVSA
ncbi:HupE/UreJ family protein [Glaciimonas sp. CA11.2]|uniref:HupE/UreJ family protein n=1 Tax=unclassified Glaciimonas TaxID=2644401 RepID=UPI002AB5A34C|nr:MULTISPECIES: HupE/UreJ family protein [unclassified Glaciimonas]MDY7548307.1 HupE/UreJ family protein [Glaciimonas sp. CA11.2]MEB0010543.1 HupE/UreJ family protein [Glaciimonas sp. Cout2]MEB0083507.1 HupE/UreJ family protein [Glaciimonas sp. Gout2]MEB0163632.1 HupE/UreJ family protein [Glaciimonas sp. CA11.2]